MNNGHFDDETLERLRNRIDTLHAEQPMGPAPLGLIPLRLSCWMTSCQHGRHCLDYLRQPRKGFARVEPGHCRDCGERIVDFNYEPCGTGQDGSEHIAHQVLDQQSELIRAHYWHVPIDQWAYNSARRLGMAELRRRLERRVVAAVADPNVFNGRSAPYAKDILAYAQHASATCCRRCAAYWHGLPSDPSDRPSEGQIKHAVAVAHTWLDVRLPELSLDPETSVSPIRTASLPTRDQINALDDDLLSSFGTGADPAGLVMPVQSHVHVADARSSLLLVRELDLRT